MANPEATQDITPAALARFDAIIDVRSPAEFAEDHVPGAINLPVLNNDERALVGTIYVQESRFKARRIGGAIVARNVARHLETALADRDGAFQPLVYCWRGGQRSGAMAVILAQVGWRTTVLTGGYKTYRRWVQRRLYDEPLALKLVLLDGGTGVGKTEMLHRLAERGAQVLDLEGLAGHRGSLFGGILGQAQPGQKLFESRLLGAIDALDPARPIVVEAESSRIGERMTPPSIWSLMGQAPRIELSAPRAERATYLVRTYGDIIRDRPALDEALTRLPVYPGRQRLADWAALADAGQFETLAEALMELHYDPAYARSSRKDQRPLLATVDLPALTSEALAEGADQIVAAIRQRFGVL
ncbi:tRNA 2-selenouridine(34) synthase MnmH [Caulobacter sp. KR2-114]|uniref:tRNA 2-selenouridine(34) synthase MnmH n=1 Tax=Caulobacter sp. KR2-114 TaxID=3400912 RepID=UPI003C026965